MSDLITLKAPASAYGSRIRAPLWAVEGLMARHLAHETGPTSS